MKDVQFRVAVFPEFLKPEVFDAISERAESVKARSAADNIGTARRANVEWGAYADPEVVRFFCGKPFRFFMSELFGKPFRMRRNWVPQLAHFHPGSGGFDCHNDREEPRDAVALLYLTPEHPEEGGGHLQIHDANKKIIRKIRPLRNTLVVFEVSDQSWHSIEDMTGNWVRRNLLFDWEVIPSC
jgi:hypothetical protein